MTNHNPNTDAETSAANTSAFDEALVQIRQALVGLKFGTLAIVVQDGVVIQLERTERRRLRKNERSYRPNTKPLTRF
jgi:hypothetical protein